jgi:hypothetical protein
MARAYATKPSKITPVKLSADTLTSIGRLVRAWAEIEDLITLFICKSMGLNESQSVLLIGKQGISRKLQIAAYIAKADSPAAAALHAHIFGDKFYDLHHCRNAVAHGVLLGKTEAGTIAFLTSKTDEPLDGGAIIEVASFTEETIAACARIAEAAIPKIEKTLKLSALREIRLQQTLVALPKGLNQQKDKPRS